MSSPSRPRRPSEAQLAQLHLAFAASSTPSAFFRPDPTPSPAYISDDDLTFEPLEPSVAETAEDEFAARAQRALLALAIATPPSASTGTVAGSGSSSSPASRRGTPDVGGSPSPESRGARDGYFSRCLFASAEAAGVGAAYGVPVSASASGASTPALHSSYSSGASTPASMPTTPPDVSSLHQTLTPLSLAALNKANMRARGVRLPPRPTARPSSPSPSPAAPSPDTPQKTVKGFDLNLDLGLGILSSNFSGMTLGAGARRRAALPADLVEVERPSSPAFKVRAKRTQYAF